MTAQRHRRKGCGQAARWAFALVLLALPALAATTERVVTDQHTGLALYGFDPVAYFTDAKPVEGRPSLEHAYAGVVWRFDNPGNRAAFARDPQVYMPRFGGYDPLGVAEGAARPGHPDLWLIVEDQLFLFQKPADRAAFARDPQAYIKAAEAKWPQVLETIVP
jgi:hypothetical protein